MRGEISEPRQAYITAGGDDGTGFEHGRGDGWLVRRSSSAFWKTEIGKKGGVEFGGFGLETGRWKVRGGGGFISNTVVLN